MSSSVNREKRRTDASLERTFSIFDFRNQADFRKSGYAFVDAAATAKTGYLTDQVCGHDFMVLAAHFYLSTSYQLLVREIGTTEQRSYCSKDTPVFGGQIANCSRI